MPDTPEGHEADRIAMREIRDLLLKASDEHEQRRDHGGQPCINFRCNAIAYLAHCLGLRQPHLRRISEILEGYESDHVHVNGRDGHG